MSKERVLNLASAIEEALDDICDLAPEVPDQLEAVRRLLSDAYDLVYRAYDQMGY